MNRLHPISMRIVVCAVLLLLFFPAVSATVVDFAETYQDYQGTWYKYTNENITLHPLYNIIDNGNNWTISRHGTTVDLPKQFTRNGTTFNVNYQFIPDRIIPSIQIDNYSQISTFVVKVNASVWYLPFPWSASQVRSVTDDLIDMGVFKRTTSITVLDSNTTPNSYQVVPKVISGDIRLYFNPQTYSGVIYPLILTENTITVDNATTAGFTSANVSFDGVRWTDNGQIAINLRNDSQANMTGLVGYWSMDENTGTAVHQVNTESGLVNTTNQGTWNGNATLNYSTGQIGNALSFDGVNDDVNAGNSTSLNINTSDFSITVWIKAAIVQPQSFGYLVSRGTAGVGEWMLGFNSGKISFYGNVGGILVQSLGTYNNDTWYFVSVVRDGDNVYLRANNVIIGNVTGADAVNLNTNLPLYFGSGKLVTTRFWKGSIDEVRIYNRALSSSEIAILYNTSMRTQGNVTILNQSASAGNVINRTRIVYTGQDSINNASIYARQNGTSDWNLIQSNATSNTWYPITNQYQNSDFRIQLDGNGSNTPFFTSLEWDDHSYFSVVPTNGTVTFAVYTWNTSGDYRKNFSVNATNTSTELNMTICDMQVNEYQNIKASRLLVNISMSNAAGCIDYLYTGGSVSNLIFIVEPAETNPYATSVAIIGGATIAALYLYRTRRTQIAQYLSRLRGRTVLK